MVLLSAFLLGASQLQAVTPVKRVDKFKPLHTVEAKNHDVTKRKANVSDLDFTLLHTETFSKCSKGSLASPDSELAQGEIPSDWTIAPYWNTSGAQQAGGALYVTTPIEYEGTDFYVLDSPVMGDAFDIFKIKIRACAPKLKDGEKMNLYLLHSAYYGQSAEMIDYEIVELTNQWKVYEVIFTSGQERSFIEFQSETGPFALNLFEVSYFPGLDTPEIKPATDVTLKSYTANWGSVKNADGYMLYPRTIHTADGLEPYYIINSDFENITEGTLASPVYPTYAVESLDGIISQPGWLGRMVMRAKGAIGITNEFLYSYGNGILQSPTVDLSSQDGKVSVKLRFYTPDVDMFQVTMFQVSANGNFTQRSFMNVYTENKYNQWVEKEFTLGGGSTSSAIVITLPSTTTGKVFFDSIEMSQVPEKGYRYIIPGESLVVAGTSQQVKTPDAVEDDARAYCVKAYIVADGSIIYSDESESIMVGAQSAEIPSELGVPANVKTATNGSAFTATWDPVPGANAYEVVVYKRHEALTEETVTVMEENFDKLKVGTTDLNYPRAMTQDGYDRLDAYTNVPGWEVYQGYYVDGAVGIWGYWNMLGMGTYMTSPVFDLSKDNGNMIISVKIGSDNLQYPQGQGATVYLAHDNPDGTMSYDAILPVDEFGYGWRNFTANWSGGTDHSYLVFFPYGYGLSYFDDIKITQKIPAGIYDTRIMSSMVMKPEVSMVIPSVDTADSYYIKVRAIWRDTYDRERVTSETTTENFLTGLRKATHYSGVVQDPDGNGVANATITLTPTSEDATPVTAKSNFWGLFQVDNIFESDVTYIATATADGYRTGVVGDLSFTGLKAIENAVITLRPATDDSVEVGLPTGYSAQGALYLHYNASETETIYPAEVLGIPSGATVKEISFDGYCLADKEIAPTVSITVGNTEATAYTEASPGMDSAGQLFWKGVKTLNAVGSREMPDEVLHFVNGAGFKYEGGSLRVALSSSATKNSQFYFLSDNRRKNASIYRYGNRTADSEWTMAKGLPVMRVLYTTPGDTPTAVETVVTGTFSVTAMPGGVKVTTTETIPVHIYDTNGRVLGIYTVKSGEPQTIAIPAGLYIVEGVKVIVK